MWRKSAIPPVMLIITQFLVIFHISFGKPATEGPFNHSTTSEPVDIDAREDGDVNSSFLETVSVLLTVLAPNDSATAEEDSTSLNTTANSTTTEPEYYDDHNLTTSSSTLNELEAVEEEDDMSMVSSSIRFGSSTESSSSLLSSLITDEMEVADSLDESVTATMLTLKGDVNDVSGRDDDGEDGIEDDGDDDRSSTDDGNVPSNSNRSRKDTATDDSIIIASMSSNLNVDTVEPLSSSHVINTDVPTKEEIISSSHLLYDGTASSSAPEPTLYSFTDADNQE